MPNAKLINWDFSKVLPEEIKHHFFDFIISTYAIHHLTDTQKISFIKSLASMLNENGKILMVQNLSFPKSYPQYDCSEDEREDISPKKAVAYGDQILAAIAKENRHFENDRGLAEYIHDEALNKKVYSLYPSVEIVDGELWGVMIAGLRESLSGEETTELLEFVTGQNSDGYGEGLIERQNALTIELAAVKKKGTSFWTTTALTM